MRTGRAPDLARTAGTVVLVLGFLALLVRVWRRPEAEEVVLASVAALALLLLTSAVYSPQYLVWLGVPAVLLAGSRPGRYALAGAAVAAALAGFSFPHFYPRATDTISTGRLLLGGRILAQLTAVAALAWALARRPVQRV